MSVGGVDRKVRDLSLQLSVLRSKSVVSENRLFVNFFSDRIPVLSRIVLFVAFVFR